MSDAVRALAISCLLLPLSSSASASEIGTSAHKFGLGLALGYPTGISGKYYPGGRNGAIEGVVGLEPGWGNDGIYVHGVYLWHPDVLAREPGFELPWHGGVGAFLTDNYGWNRNFGGGFIVGARGQIGLDFDLEDVRLQISGDLGLNLGWAEFGGFGYDGSFHLTVRYFF